MYIISGYIRLLILMAVLPGAFLLYQVYKLDRVEKEPISLVLKLFFASIASIIFAFIVESIGGSLLGIIFPENSLYYQVIEYFLVVALSEEYGKYFVLKKLTWDNPEFNYRYDAIVYAVCVGMGFAVFENIEYAFSFGMANTLLRAVTAIPAHCIFAIFMGHYYGMAKYCERIGSNGEGFYKVITLLIPVLLHGLYDFVASSEDVYSAGVFLLLVIIMDFVAYKKVKQYANEDAPL